MTRNEIESLGWVWAKKEMIHDGYKLETKNMRGADWFELVPSHPSYGLDQWSLYMVQNGNRFCIFSGTLATLESLEKVMTLTIF